MAATETGVWDLQEVRDKQLASEWTYSGSSDEDGSLWSWGFGGAGRLGQNSQTNLSSPTQIGGGETWSDLGSDGRILVGYGGLKSDGTLWVWGENNYGKLGQNQAPAQLDYRSSPVQVPGTSWTQFSRSSRVFSAIKTDGTLWTWGSNSQGQLGHNSKVDYSSPTQVPGTTWKAVSCAYPYTAATKTDGTLWAWGRNDQSGQLGQNDIISRSSPTQIPGTTWAFSYVAEKEIWATKTDGTLWGIGYNNDGQLAQNTNGNNTQNYSSPVQIPGTTWAVGQNRAAAGYFNFWASKSDGTLWFMGEGGYGTSGLNNQTEYSSPVQIPGTTWKIIAAGTTQTGAVKTDGTLWTWGSNTYGQLGLNNRTQYNSPKQVPGSWATDKSLVSEWNGFLARKQP